MRTRVKSGSSIQCCKNILLIGWCSHYLNFDAIAICRRLTIALHLCQYLSDHFLQKLNRSNDNLVSLENDHTHLKSRLQRAEKLKEEVELLSHELQVLGDLYQQQKEQSLRFLGQSRHEYQSKAMHSALKNEKEMVEKKTVGLQLQLSVAQAKVTELKDVVARREEEIRALCGKLQNIQEKYQSKMSVSCLSQA